MDSQEQKAVIMGPGSSNVFKPKSVFIYNLATYAYPTTNCFLPFILETTPFTCKSSVDYLSLTGLSILVLSLQSLLLYCAFALGTEVCIGGETCLFLLSRPSFSFLKGCRHLCTHFTDQIGLSDPADVL